MSNDPKENEAEVACGAACQKRTITEELEAYGNHQSLWYVNRDGDKCYIECPDCHNMDLTSLRVLGCSYCHTRFTVYPEDGIRYQSLVTEMGRCSAGGELRIVGKEKDAHFKQILYPRNYEKAAEIVQMWPHAEIVTLQRDLQKDGKDAHGHALYKKYVLIPIA